MSLSLVLLFYKYKFTVINVKFLEHLNYLFKIWKYLKNIDL